MYIWCTGSGWLCSVEEVVWFGILGRLKEKRKSGQSFVSLNFLLSSNSFSQIQTQLCQAKPMVILKNERWVVWCMVWVAFCSTISKSDLSAALCRTRSLNIIINRYLYLRSFYHFSFAFIL